MNTNMLRVCAVLACGLATSQVTLRAQEKSPLEGVWHVSVTVKDCTTGAPIRVVNSLQQFRNDGSMIETANTALRGISEGVWSNGEGDAINASYWFFRYTPTGTFASLARITDTITVDGNGQFVSAGMVQDYDAKGVLLTTGCFTHAATRLTHTDR